MAKKKLTLDETWKYCIAFWKWRLKQPLDADIDDLKQEWLNEKGFEDILFGCFFCNWARYTDEQGREQSDCERCPAVLVEPDANKDGYWCYLNEHNHNRNPKAFYAELLRLNKIRKEKKAKVKRG